METTIVLILLTVFAVSMTLMHKFGGLCTATPAASARSEETPRARRFENDSYTPVTPDYTPPMRPSLSLNGPVSPRSDYAISITDSTIEDLGVPDVPVVTRTTRVVSFLRFSGYSRSDVSLADRSTSQSFWSSFSYATGSECREVGEISDVADAPKVNFLPRQHHAVEEEVDCVEIGELDGFKQRNLLSFKPQKPRGLTTKHIKKQQHAPVHTVSL